MAQNGKGTSSASSSYPERSSLGSDTDSNNSELSGSRIDSGQLFEGENYKVILEGCSRIMRFQPETIASQIGTLFLTTFRLRFVPKPCTCKTAEQLGPPKWHSGGCDMKGPISPWGTFIHSWPPAANILSEMLCPVDQTSIPRGQPNLEDASVSLAMRFAYDIPLFGIRKAISSGRELRLICRDGRSVEIELSSEHEVEGLMRVMSSLAFPKDEVAGAFAFQTRYRVGLGWDVYDAEMDAAKTIVSRSKIPLKKTSSPCETYPKSVYLPEELSVSDIQGSAAFRSMRRIPVAVWAHPKNGSVLVRSAQPLVGLLGNRSAADENLIRALCGSNYLLLDARSRAAALGNRAMGKGTESIERGYEGAQELVFSDLGNIHHLKSTANSLIKFFTDPQRDSAWPMDPLSSLSAYNSPEIGAWLTNVAQLLRASLRIVEAMDIQGLSAWTHCSDGWDRTSQMCALAQLMMEPDYRTRVGFAAVVEKNFGTFGFKFRDRSRGVSHHASSLTWSPKANGTRANSPGILSATGEITYENDEEEASPVFTLFLDCVFQLIRQFPERFEFNQFFLIALADATASGRFGTFLCNTEKERIDEMVTLETRSVWDWICFDDTFRNSKFDPYNGVLFPNCSLRAMRLFDSYWARFDPTRIENPMRICFF